ncbi:hypothetical protein GF345_03595 [Candidatus Woesearchaeota archaeon]|nr:hypothetical protein [Candidatus Woesearchaeota archaeon]
MEFDYPGAAEDKEQESPHTQDEPPAEPEEPEPSEPEPAEPQPDPDKPISQHAEPDRKRPSDPTEAFVQEMVESGKKPFEPGKPNNADEDPEKIEDITNRIRDRLQKGQ